MPNEPTDADRIPPEERCWFKRFSLDDPDACPLRGEYSSPDDPSRVLRAFRWCLIHRHPGDVRLESLEGRTDER